MERVFQPWIGSNYETGSVHNCRILILGESHYGKPTDARLDFTNYIVERYAIKERRRFFSVVRRLVSLDTKRGSYSLTSKRIFWNSVAFCNYVQAIVGCKARQRPTAAMWNTGARVLLQVLKETQPEVVVVLRLELKKYLPALPVGIETAYIKHPSGRGMKYSECQPPIRAAIERTIAQRNR
ncbi:hypothetical protein [Pseudomonas mohnii]